MTHGTFKGLITYTRYVICKRNSNKVRRGNELRKSRCENYNITFSPSRAIQRRKKVIIICTIYLNIQHIINYRNKLVITGSSSPGLDDEQTYSLIFTRYNRAD